MPAPPYYRFFLGDYLRDANHLSLLEHGAYRRLIDLYMIEGGPLPFDMPRLYRLLHATSKEEQAAVQVVVEEFFKMDGPLLRQKRCDRELAFQRHKAEKAAGAAGHRWRSKEERNQEPVSERIADAMQSVCHPDPDPDLREELLLSPFVDTSPAPNAGPACPVQKIIDLWNSTVAAAGGQKAMNLSKARRETIVRRWREVAPASTSEGLTWFEQLFRDRIAASKFCTGRQPGKDGRVYRIGIDTAMRSELQLDQIAEGKYA